MSKTIAAIFLVAYLAAANANAEEKKLVVVGGVDYAFKNLSLDVGAAPTWHYLTGNFIPVSPTMAPWRPAPRCLLMEASHRY